MKQFRVVYFGQSEREPDKEQLHDTKFDTKVEAIDFAMTVKKGLVYVQHFSPEGIPLETLFPKDLEGKDNE